MGEALDLDALVARGEFEDWCGDYKYELLALIERVRQLEAAQKVYDRETLVTILIYHWRTNTSGCGCGWSVLGASHAEHVADVYEESIAARLSEVEEQRSE